MTGLDGDAQAARTGGLACALMLIALLVVFGPCLHTDYLYADDYVWFTVPRGLAATRTTFGQARPLFGAAVDLLNTGSVRHSGWRRSVGVLGLALLSSLLFHRLRKGGLSPLEAGVLALTTSCLPSFLTIGAYLHLTALPYSSVLSGASFCIFLAACEDESTPPRRQAAAALAASLLLFVSLSCYQLSAMFCWVMIAITLATCPGDRLARLLRVILRYGLLCGLTLAAYFAMYKLIFLARPDLAFQSGRSALVDSAAGALEKMCWFGSTVLSVACRDMLLLIGNTSGSLDGIARPVLLCGCLATAVAGFHAGPMPRGLRAARALSICAAVPLGYLPFLLIRENGATSYYVSNVEAVLHLLFLLGAVRVLRGRPAPLLAVLLLVSVSANRLVLSKYALPNALEYRYVRNVLARADLAAVRHVHVVGHLNFSHVLSYSEELVRVALADAGAGDRAIAVTSSSDPAPDVMHAEILERSEVFRKHYRPDSAFGYYTLRPDITDRDRAELDGYMRSLAQQFAARRDALVIDLAGAGLAYR